MTSVVCQVLDPAIADAPGNEIQIVNALAVACCKHNFWERPRMKEVLPLLTLKLQLPPQFDNVGKMEY